MPNRQQQMPTGSIPSGVPAVDAFGPVESGMHTTEEKVYIPTITEKTALLRAMLGIMKEEQFSGLDVNSKRSLIKQRGYTI